jgi:hypothetical protein
METPDFECKFEARSAIEQHQPTQANSALTTAMTRLGVLLNTLDTQSSITESNCIADIQNFRPTLSNRTELVIDHLIDARTTTIES